MSVIFKKVSQNITEELLKAYESGLRLNKDVTIGCIVFKLVYISKTSNTFHKSRGLSLYFKTKKSIVRISDHWSSSIGNERSRKMNCCTISGNQHWILKQKTDRYEIKRGCGKYPFTVLVGIAGLQSLNKECEHFRNV